MENQNANGNSCFFEIERETNQLLTEHIYIDSDWGVSAAKNLINKLNKNIEKLKEAIESFKKDITLCENRKKIANKIQGSTVNLGNKFSEIQNEAANNLKVGGHPIGTSIRQTIIKCSNEADEAAIALQETLSNSIDICNEYIEKINNMITDSNSKIVSIQDQIESYYRRQNAKAEEERRKNNR